jgi:arylsulfatase A-like enzyme
MLDQLEVVSDGVVARLPGAAELEQGVPVRPAWALELRNDGDAPADALVRFRGKLFLPPPSEVHDKYPQEVARVDRAVGEVRAALHELGLADRALLAVLSDHGEGLYRHHVLGHAEAVFEDQLRMLWVMAGPGIEPGVTVDGPVLHTDFLPTVLDLLSLPLPDRVEGRSLRACWESGECRVRRSWRSYGIRRPQMQIVGAARYRWPLKAISHRKRGTLLFDLSRDPHEFARLSVDTAGAAVRELGSAADADRDALQSIVESRAGAGELDERSRRALRALGYL